MNESGSKALSSVLIRGKPTFIYLPSLITCWKHFLVKAKTTIQYYDNLAVCFGNKWNFMKWRSDYLKMFDKKLSLISCVI